MEQTGGHGTTARAGATAAVVLAGGRSSRFGSDKTRAELHGRTLLARVLDVAAPLVDEVLVVGAWAPAGVRRTSEPEPHLGPLAGLVHGLGIATADRALVLAGDHPLLSAALLQLLLDTARDPGADAVVPVGPDGPEPLVACYRSSVVDAATARLATGDRSLRGLLGAVRTRWVEVAEWDAVDPQGRSFLDVDAPGDLDALGRLGPER